MPTHPHDPYGDDQEKRELPDVDEIIDRIFRVHPTSGRRGTPSHRR